jgi:para-nitrobenzyl esterase
MQPTVTVREGAVRGRVVDGVSAFLGIPYAAAPTGALRFRAPAPAEKWDGVRDAVEFGPTALKPPYVPPFDELLYDPVIPGENCLNLNVWTPDPGASGLPVMVWIHGGAFRNGSSAVPWYDGAAFARDGVVLVSLNYRLGAEGFGLLPDAPANLGLRDQLAALAWVKDNIATFGGDPDRVTIFGESAGAMSVTTLVSLPAARGLFSRAIAQSGAGHSVARPEDARKVTAELGNKLGVEPTARALAQIEPEALVAAQQAVSVDLTRSPDPARWGQSIVSAGMAFVPVVDGDLVAQRPIDALTAGAAADVEMMIGTTTEEYRFFLAPIGVTEAATEELVRGFLAGRGWDPAILETYAANRPGASAGDVLAAVITDSFFRVPAMRLAEAQIKAGPATYVYEFAWRTPVGRLGACHALEIPFVFDTLATTEGHSMTGPNPPQPLADRMHAAWVSFARDGDPGWSAFDLDRRSVMTFDHPGARLVDDPRAEERELWNDLV